MNASQLVGCLVLCWSSCVMLNAAEQTQGDVQHEFIVDADESYSDYVQFEDGHAQGVCVFYFKTEHDGFNRVVAFCTGNATQGKAYEDLANKRVVVTRPLREFEVFCRYQSQLSGNDVYGIWVTRADGQVTRFAIQSHRSARVTRVRPSIGAEYTGNGSRREVAEPARSPLKDGK